MAPSRRREHRSSRPIHDRMNRAVASTPGAAGVSMAPYVAGARLKDEATIAGAVDGRVGKHQCPPAADTPLVTPVPVI